MCDDWLPAFALRGREHGPADWERPAALARGTSVRQERVKHVTSDLPVAPYKFCTSFAILIQKIDCKSGHTSGSYGRHPLIQQSPMQRSYPSGSMGPLGPLRALIWHLTVHPPSHTALSHVSLLPASALFAKACWTLCLHQATGPSSPAAVQHTHPSAYTCSLAHSRTAG